MESNIFNLPEEDLKKDCDLCQGRGFYYYDEHHGKPCEKCCKHSKGWWLLTENHGGYIEGGDNRCCMAGCGALYREVFNDSKT